MAWEDFCCGPIGILILFIGVPLFFSAVRIIMQYQSGVVLRLGRFVGLRRPGVNFLVPFIDTMRVVDMRIQTLDIPKQEVLTKDNISVFVNAVVYYKISDPEAAVLKVQDFANAIFQHGQAAIRDVVGSVEMDTLLSDRETIASNIRKIVAAETHGWGIDIISINMQDIELPDNMKKAMARQAQAEREKRATVIISSGEVEASTRLAQAADLIAASPGALHLRTLQALSSMSADKTNNITFLLPLEGNTAGEMPDPSAHIGKKSGASSDKHIDNSEKKK